MGENKIRMVEESSTSYGGFLLMVLWFVSLVIVALLTAGVYGETIRMKQTQVEVYKELYVVKAKQFAAVADELSKMKLLYLYPEEGE